MSYEAEQIAVYLDRFVPIYRDGKEINPIPENVAITVYCERSDDCGFIENITHDQMGIEELIAKSWILQDDLDSLLSGMPTASNNGFNLTPPVDGAS
jgi:hypothetical protein